MLLMAFLKKGPTRTSGLGLLSLLVATNDSPQTTDPVTDPQGDFPIVVIDIGPSISALNREQFSLNGPGLY